MHRSIRLSKTDVERIRKPGRYSEGRGGHGLALLIRQASDGGLSKSWVQRIRINGRPTNLGLGPAPSVTLDRARELALENWRAVFDGFDPRKMRTTIPTFEAAAEAKIKLASLGWKNGKTETLWRSRLQAYVYPVIGSKRVDRITSADVLDVLRPVYEASHTTAVKIRQSIRATLGWAIGAGHRTDNPAGDSINEAIPKPNARGKHHRAIGYTQVAEALEIVGQSEAWWATVSAFRFLVLTAARSGEVRGARWSEIDREARTWTIPALRMKSEREHRVPLSDATLDVLDRAEALADGSGLIFPSMRGLELSDSTISKLLRENGVEAVPHGFRSSFRDWCAENNVPRELAEQSLAHAVANATEAAYLRSDVLERRREVMQRWADYLA